MSFEIVMPRYLTSKTRLFADDCILYRQIYNHDDSITLQQDLDNLAAWEKKMLYRSRCFKMLLTTMCSKSLQHIQVSDTGL
jgi:hypothetical protein